ncbi:PH1570 family protein [Myroides injenensis]|uniref:PH1570 family protein n=1 Tax=Myroides injenensis TaxID=1183151 RepID=UPI00028A3105|nr:PH1570 family protein [Myroides injenensis]
MKKIIALLIILFSIQSINAQENHIDKIRSLKIAHLTTALNLTKSEAEKFWPIYNTYDNKMGELRHSQIVKFIKTTDIEDIEAMTEKDASNKIQELIDFETDYFTIRKQFLVDAKKILSNKKILILKKAEDDFNRKLLKKYKEKK